MPFLSAKWVCWILFFGMCDCQSLTNVFIRGRNALCLESLIQNERPVIISTCRLNQPGTHFDIHTDGTIRYYGSAQMCLTTSGYTPGSNLTFSHCGTNISDAAKWETISDDAKWETVAWNTGETLRNPRSGLVLTATSGDSGTRVTLQTNTYASIQGWSAVRGISGLHTFHIIGLNNLCLYTDGGASLWLTDCASAHDTMRWIHYPDGTIRPAYNQNLCIKRRESDNLVVLFTCTGSNDERWTFASNGLDGPITSLYSNLVLDVKESNPSLKQIITHTYTGNPNQQWRVRSMVVASPDDNSPSSLAY